MKAIELSNVEPFKVRKLISENRFIKATAGVSAGYAQTNLAILPCELAFDFLIFAQRNPKPCPILEVMKAGEYISKICAPGDDIREIISKYRIYRNGKLDKEVSDIKEYWREDLVTFLLGCSFTFENALIEAGIPMRHIDEGKNVPMFITNIKCNKGGVFTGPMVVSMRPIHYSKVVNSVLVTSKYPAVHGAPIHIGEPKYIGIEDINKPDYGDAVSIKEGEIPVFWACGVTPQAVAMEVKPELMITHAPGHMLVTDIKDKDLADN